MGISSVRGLVDYIKHTANFSGKTINSVIYALGFHPRHGTPDEYNELSNILIGCLDYERSEGYKRLFKHHDNISFIKKHRQDIVFHMEAQAEEMDMDILYLLNHNIISPKKPKMSAAELGKALWSTEKFYVEPTMLYNYLTKYVLCEIAYYWNDYFELQPV